MEDIELTELDDEILKQKLEVLEYDFEKICASYIYPFLISIL